MKKKVTVKIHKKIETRKVKETKPTALAMPTEFVAQNGEPSRSATVIKENTPIAVTGCPKAKPAREEATKMHKAHGKDQR